MDGTDSPQTASFTVECLKKFGGRRYAIRMRLLVVEDQILVRQAIVNLLVDDAIDRDNSLVAAA